MNINNRIELNAAIQQLETRKKAMEELLAEQYIVTAESLKPINLIKNAVGEIADKSDIMETLLNATIGMGTGLLTKKILIGKSNTFIKKIMGGMLEFGVANFIAKNSDTIKAVGSGLIDKVFRQKKKEMDT